MKKKLIGFVIFSFFLAGCQNTSSLMVKKNSLMTADPKIFFEAFSDQKNVYEEAYQQALIVPQALDRPKAVVLGLDSQKKAMAGFFKSLEKNDYETIVVIGQIDSASSDPGSPLKTVPAYLSVVSLKTPYGFLKIDEVLARKLVGDKLFATHENFFRKHKAFFELAPFIQKSFPRARYLPILVSEQASDQQIRQLTKALATSSNARMLVIVESGFLLSADKAVAEFELKFARNALETLDPNTVKNLPMRAQKDLQFLATYIATIKSQKAEEILWDDKNGLFIETFGEGVASKPRKLFIVSLGDIMLGRQVRSRMNKNGLDYPFQKIDQRYLQYNDLLVANLEGPITDKVIKTGKAIAFHFGEDTAGLLKKYFFDALSQANNHTLDMGKNGYSNTRTALQNQRIVAFGNPRGLYEDSIGLIKIQDQTIALLGFNDVDFKIDRQKTIQKVKELHAKGYVVIPFGHWGIEYKHTPSRHQIELAHAFIDAGADAFIGHHPHVVQTYETYNNKPIFYSLGNAIFDQEFSPDTQEGLSIGLILPTPGSGEQTEIYFLPLQIEKSQMRLMNPQEKAAFLERFVTYGAFSEEEKKQLLKGGLKF